MSGLKNDIVAIAQGAKKASFIMGQLSSKVKDAALIAMADSLERNKAAIIAANKKDVKTAQAKKLNVAFIDRLTLNVRVAARGRGPARSYRRSHKDVDAPERVMDREIKSAARGDRRHI